MLAPRSSLLYFLNPLWPKMMIVVCLLPMDGKLDQRVSFFPAGCGLEKVSELQFTFTTQLTYQSSTNTLQCTFYVKYHSETEQRLSIVCQRKEL